MTPWGWTPPRPTSTFAASKGCLGLYGFKEMWILLC